MNTLRLRTVIQRMSLPLFVLCLLVQPALAQKSNSIVTIEQSGDKETVVIKIEDGKRTVTVDGKVLDDEEADEYLDKMDMIWVGAGEHGFHFDPKSTRFHVFADNDSKSMAELRERMKEDGLNSYFFDHNNDDEDGSVFFLNDQLRGLRDGLAVFGKDGLTLQMGESMKERAEIARMDMESRRLAMKIREADAADRADLERELRDQLEDILDRKEALRAEQVDALRKQLDEAVAARQERQQNRQEIIERRMKELLGERDKYDW